MGTHTIKKLLLTTGVCSGLLIAANPAFAMSDAELETLKSQMEMFAKKLETLEQEQSVLKKENAILKEQNEELQAENASLEKNITVASDKIDATAEKYEKIAAAAKVSSIEPAAGKSNGALIPGTNTRVKLGGYVKADVIHDFNVTRTGGGEDFGLYAAIPLEGSTAQKKGSNTRIHARQTRLNLTATTPTDYGDLKVFVEGDFFAEDGSQQTTNAARFGMRHAYGQLGSFLAGQTWSNYMDLAAYPESLDFQGVSGNTLLRQGQVRYTYQPEGSANSYSIAIENPSTDYISDPSNTANTDSDIDKLPDVTAKARFVGDFSEFSLKGVGRLLEAHSTVTGQSDDEFAYAVAASGKLKAWGKDDFRFQVGYGDGISRYIYDLAATSQAASFTASTNTLETIEAWGGYAAYRHWWNDSVRSNLIAGTTRVIDNPSTLNAASTNKSVMSAHANLIWSVTPKVDVGAEYIYGHRETESDAEGKLHRGQFSAKYKF